MAPGDARLGRHCHAADELARRLGVGGAGRRSLEQTFERWDGKCAPAGARGEEILLTARLVQLADVVEVFHRERGIAAAIAVARDRSGTNSTRRWWTSSADGSRDFR